VERKAAGHARDVIAKAERTVSRNRRMRNGLIRDAILAVILAIIIAAFWKPMMLLLTAVAVP
jgi:hypothetical protein